MEKTEIELTAEKLRHAAGLAAAWSGEERMIVRPKGSQRPHSRTGRKEKAKEAP